jgi:hypothetical protein
VAGPCSRSAIEVHHLLPRAFEDVFRGKGLDIGKYVIDLPRWQHRLKPFGVHTGPNNWNAMWKAWIETHPTATAEEILAELARLRILFGI